MVEDEPVGEHGRGERLRRSEPALVAGGLTRILSLLFEEEEEGCTPPVLDGAHSRHSRAALSLPACLLLSSAEPDFNTVHLAPPERAAEPHLIQDAAFRAKVEAQFAKQAREFFDVLRRKLTLEEREALKFLFAFMPLSDLADYDGE